MQHRGPDTGPDRCPPQAPDRAYIALQLEEARAAARTLYELSPDPLRVEPLYRALMHALSEVAQEVDTQADRHN